MRPPRVAVIGGSLGGLTAALVLRDIGCDVTVYERARTPLTGFGAGIVVHRETVRYLTERADISLDRVSAPSTLVRYLGRDGAVVHQEPSPYRFTAWSALYRNLLGCLEPARYLQGWTLTGLEPDGDGVRLGFAEHEPVRADLVVCADGLLSTARGLLLPGCGPVYAGYVGWRGMVNEAALTRESFETLYEALTYGLVSGGHIVAYPIPNLDGRLEPGRRLMNFVWYRNVAEGPDLDALMTDRDGVRRAISLHPGSVGEEFVAELRETAEASLPPQLAEMVVRTPSPFLQAIVDIEVPRMAFGRVALMGDAAFGGRPHAAAGSAKAAADAWALAGALQDADMDVEAALAAWETPQLALGAQLQARVRDMGERSQFRGDWRPGDPSLRFGLYAPGD